MLMQWTTVKHPYITDHLFDYGASEIYLSVWGHNDEHRGDWYITHIPGCADPVFIDKALTLEEAKAKSLELLKSALLKTIEAIQT